ncbi:DUF1476 domain-containing protein [Aureimonas sp. AU22]|jgi:hypothetical protein|uniref:DUF1476 domain-containing protein n=1 Tax=Aureimonas sp. AU22 TaxID=1638162 RepID=UPI00070604B9|nr:DUF1476 domain-containing protein [Aureimonas sp. AU22]BAT30279.1 hypothetical protein [Aureimonas sp. AU22]
MSLNDRGHDQEARYAHEEDRKFRIEVRATKLLGLWAAGKLGKNAAEAEAYAIALANLDLGAKGPQDVFAKVRADFDAAGVNQSDHQIERHRMEYMEEAEKQIAAS